MRRQRNARSLLHTFFFGIVVIASGARAQELAFTWDDLPAHGPLPAGETREAIVRRIAETMRAEHLPEAFGFVNGIRITEEPDSARALAAWRDAGFPLGNHTFSHLNLGQHSAAEFEADLIKNEALLKHYANDRDWHWFRFPNLVEGDTPAKRNEVRAFLAAHRYKIAGVTMSFGDYAYNEPYARCVAKGDDASITVLEEAYLTAADAAVDYDRSMAQALFGHDIPYVLLMHVGALDARLLPRLLARYRRRGITFISLEQAEKDAFYRNDLDPALPGDIDTLEAAMHARDLPVPPRPKPSLDLEKICR